MRLLQLPDEAKRRHNIKVGAKVPRFDLVQISGYSKSWEALKNKDGQIYFYLNEARGIINSPDSRRADRFLMGKGSLNFSSVFLLECEPSNGYFVGYGNPNGKETYSKNNKPNPFYECRDDGYLFLISEDWRTIEVFVIPNGKNTILGNAKALNDGVYNDMLKPIREAATTFFQY